jgi:hypothetical protein
MMSDLETGLAAMRTMENSAECDPELQILLAPPADLIESQEPVYAREDSG